jgi:esterase/lipase superfamily enzyme
MGSQLMRELNHRYRTALAEPVSVVAWEANHSTSQIFYATNRVGEIQADGQVHFGSAWGHDLALGTCHVTLPKRERGKDPEVPKARIFLASWLPGFAKKENTQDAAVTVAPPQGMTSESFFAQVRQTVDRAPERDVLLFVHGFNVDFAASLTRTTQIALDLPFNGVPIAYSWPSQGGIDNYDDDERIVAESVVPFVSFLEQLNQSLPPDTRIHIVVHSMGNRLVLHGLNQLSEGFRQPPRFENVVLAAPDVGVSDFAALSHGVVTAAKRVTLYVHDSDTALIASKAVNGEQRIGDAFPPVVVPSVETIDASAIDTSFMGHSYYGSNRRALSDLFALLKENCGAAERSWLKSKSNASGSWWVFASQPAEIRHVWYFDGLARQTPGVEIR